MRWYTQPEKSHATKVAATPTSGYASQASAAASQRKAATARHRPVKTAV